MMKFLLELFSPMGKVSKERYWQNFRVIIVSFFIVVPIVLALLLLGDQYYILAVGAISAWLVLGMILQAFNAIKRARDLGIPPILAGGLILGNKSIVDGALVSTEVQEKSKNGWLNIIVAFVILLTWLIIGYVEFYAKKAACTALPYRTPVLFGFDLIKAFIAENWLVLLGLIVLVYLLCQSIFVFFRERKK